MNLLTRIVSTKNPKPVVCSQSCTAFEGFKPVKLRDPGKLVPTTKELPSCLLAGIIILGRSCKPGFTSQEQVRGALTLATRK